MENRIRKPASYKLWLLPGIFGALLIGAGDWLLGYVLPVRIVGAGCSLFRLGYTQGYALWRPVAAMAAGGLGAACYLPFLWGMRLSIQPGRARKAFSVTAAFSLFGWLLLHFFYCALLYQYSWLCQSAGTALADGSATALYNAFFPVVAPWYLVMAVPFLIHFIAILRDRTHLPWGTAFLHPVVWTPCILFIASLLPESAFSYSLHMGAINESMLLWSIAALLLGKREVEPVSPSLGGFPDEGNTQGHL